MDSQKLRLDHFQVYDVANQDAGFLVGLQGQFDEQRERAKLTYLNAFANPVSKNGEPIYDKNAHLTWYNLFDYVPEPTRLVVFENQFGVQKILTGRAIALLAPAQKYEKGSEFPKELDHYKVYQVLQGEPVGRGVKLRDQFDHREAEVTYPWAFAVPVRKWHEGSTFGVHNAKAHLAFYKITPGSVQKARVVRDQFGRRYLHIYRSVLLGVPSVKREWSLH
jgi:catechol 2,3-dioxygenase-like lactoylglutathione lyase family enzyme